MAEFRVVDSREIPPLVSWRVQEDEARAHPHEQSELRASRAKSPVANHAHDDGGGHLGKERDLEPMVGESILEAVRGDRERHQNDSAPTATLLAVVVEKLKTPFDAPVPAAINEAGQEG